MLLFFLAALAAVAAAWWLSRGAAGGGDPVEGAGVVTAAPSGQPAAAAATAAGGASAAGGGHPGAATPAANSTLGAGSPIPPAAGTPRIALVIDDLGRSVEDVRRLSRLGVPVTYAVLPFETLTPEVVAEVGRLGGELVLHLPMEGRNGANPGPGALRMGMPRNELVAATRAAMGAVPGAVGVNNHMGSVLSADASSMRAVLREIAGDGVYFLDSRTTAESVAYPAARELGIAAAERDVFLDGELTEEAVREQFRRVLEVAREEGSGIAIGHPHEVTLGVLEEQVPRAEEAGFRFVEVSALVDRSVLPE